MNWDKPLSKEDFIRMTAEEVTTYHGFNDWVEFTKYLTEHNEHKYWNISDYHRLCEWIDKLMNSPLGQALK